MATKMNAEIAKRVKALGIKAADEESARKQLLAILTKNEIEGMEEEDTMTLIEVAESFVENKEQVEEEPENNVVVESEEELDELAQEAEAEDASDEKDEPEDNAEEGGDEFDSMDRAALKRYIKAHELEISVKKSTPDDEIRAAIRAAIEEPAQEEEKPVEKPAKKEKKAKAEKKGKAEKKEVGKRSAKLDPQHNEEDRKYFDALHELFPEDKYAYDWLSNAGVTVKHRGKNSLKAVFKIKSCSLAEDGTIKCNLYFTSLKKNFEVLENMELDVKKNWSGAPFLKGITMDDAIEFLKELKEECVKDVEKSDKRLGENRAKMEEGLKKSDKKKSKK